METAWNVEPVCATTQNSLKDPTVNMTRPSVRDMEVSFATVQRLSCLKIITAERLVYFYKSNVSDVIMRILCVNL